MIQRAKRQHAERFLVVEDGACYCIDRTVAAPCHNHVTGTVSRASRKLDNFSATMREGDVDVESTRPEGIGQTLSQVVTRTDPGARVDNYFGGCCWRHHTAGHDALAS